MTLILIITSNAQRRLLKYVRPYVTWINLWFFCLLWVVFLTVAILRAGLTANEFTAPPPWGLGWGF